ncbi:MAG TPA: hypothetical protein P5048_01305 [Chlamydiales bacterium]|nr:hypothetical protein [Chlamydiales bacterium]
MSANILNFFSPKNRSILIETIRSLDSTPIGGELAALYLEQAHELIQAKYLRNFSLPLPLFELTKEPIFDPTRYKSAFKIIHQPPFPKVEKTAIIEALPYPSDQQTEQPETGQQRIFSIDFPEEIPSFSLPSEPTQPRNPKEEISDDEG